MKNPVPFTHLLTLLSGFPSRSREGCIPPVPDSPSPLSPLSPTVSDWAESRLGFRPDPLQAQILDSSSRRLILLCARQFGKSTLAAIKALHFALARPNSTVLCVSPTLRRSTEWLRLVQHFFSILSSPQTEPRGSSPEGCDQAVKNTTSPPFQHPPIARAARDHHPNRAARERRRRDQAVILPQRGSSPKGCDQAVKTPPPQPSNTLPSRRRRDQAVILPQRGSSPQGCDQAVKTPPPQPSNTLPSRRRRDQAVILPQRGSSPQGCDQAVKTPPPQPPDTSPSRFPSPFNITHNRPIPVPVPRPRTTAHSLTLPNRSRILALPGTAHSNRGYSAHLLLFEEAAFIPDPVFTALLPTVAATGGAVWLISSAGPPSGFFYEIWTQPDLPYTRFKADATQCPRITQEHLDEARLALGELRFRREYLCEFSPDALPIFSPDLLESALDDSFEPWLAEAA